MGQKRRYKVERVTREFAEITLHLTDQELHEYTDDEIAQMVINQVYAWHKPASVAEFVGEMERKSLPEPIAHGWSEWRPRTGDPGGLKWCLFGKDAVDVDDDTLIVEAKERGFIVDEHHGGPGRWFADEPYTPKRTRTRVLIVQRSGMDI